MLTTAPRTSLALLSLLCIVQEKWSKGRGNDRGDLANQIVAANASPTGSGSPNWTTLTDGCDMTDIVPADWPKAYARVQEMMFADEAVWNGQVYPRWIEDTGRFWYERAGSEGTEYRIVDAATGRGWVVTSHNAIAEALSTRLGRPVPTTELLLISFRILPLSDRAQFDALGASWEFVFASGELCETRKRDDRKTLVSPDGKLGAFTKDGNLWIRDLETGEERGLTTDGSHNWAYSETPNTTRWQKDHVGGHPEALWSPDSTRLLTLRTDEREVLPMPYIEFAPEGGKRPRVHDNPVSLPGDEKITRFQILLIDVATGHQSKPDYPTLPSVRMNDTPFSAGLVWWSADGDTAYFVDIERFEKAAHVVALNVATGETRTVFSETSDTYVELGVNVYARSIIFPLAQTNELIWYSERSGDGHLYLYDLATGRLKNTITAGNWRVRDVQHIDLVRREIFFTAAGIAPGEDPYVCKPCIVSLDGGEVRIVSGEFGEHLVWRSGEYALIFPGFLGADMLKISGVSPDGEYFVETVGSVDAFPQTFLRRRDGTLISIMETATDAGLPSGWTWPEAVALKADDGVTDVYGLLFKPPHYDPEGSYPIVDLIYGGPQVALVPKSAFTSGGIMGEYVTAASLAQLGMFVFLLDGRGTAHRERAFRTASYGAIETVTNIEDHIAGIRQLADRDTSIDLTRVGITGFSGGGTATVFAALRHGNFFKAAVAGGGKYDEALFGHTWGERYQGAYEPELYARAAAKTYIDGLTGKLLIVHGMMDSGVHPASVFQLLQAAIDANKDIDLVLLPRVGHQLTGYGERRRLDYFVQHLFGDVPPAGVRMVTRRELNEQRMKRNAEQADTVSQMT
jgi:dipeptidyl-peptidase-4